MAENEPAAQSPLKKRWTTFNETIKFISLLLGVISTAIALWVKIAGADDTVKKTYDKVEQLNEKILYIQGRLGISPK
jgi:hypothetical protein